MGRHRCLDRARGLTRVMQMCHIITRSCRPPRLNHRCLPSSTKCPQTTWPLRTTSPPRATIVAKMASLESKRVSRSQGCPVVKELKTEALSRLISYQRTRSTSERLVASRQGMETKTRTHLLDSVITRVKLCQRLIWEVKTVFKAQTLSL